MNFHWLSICGGFFAVYFLLVRRKNDREKSLQNVPPNSVRNVRPYTLSRENTIFATSRTPSEKSHDSYLREIFPRVLLLGGNFSDLTPWLSFLLWWCLSLKIWVKPLVSRRSISHRLLCVPFFILTLQWLARGVR